MSGERKRIAVRVTADALRHISNGHPWVYDDAINSLSHEGEPGDLAVIFDSERRFRAVGLYDPRSPIRIKILHAGRSQNIDANFWRLRINNAVALRAPLINDVATTGYRVLNGENDGLPGLVLDRYDQTLVCKVYSEAWFAHLPAVLEAIVEILSPERIVLRLARSIADADAKWQDGDTVVGGAPEAPIMFLENGLHFEADVIRGQKTGHFLDQRDNREIVRQHAKDRRVLDVFASTGGFTVYAAAGGASEVHSVDLSSPTLAVAKRNLAHNESLTSGTKHLSIAGDAFGVLAGMIAQDERYDVVIVDPPSFAQRQVDVRDAIVAYRRMASLSSRLVHRGGLLVSCSCSSRVSAEDFFDAVYDGAESAGVRLDERLRTDHAIDHPVTFAQGAYLKAIFTTVR